jgi:hypothetical protein
LSHPSPKSSAVYNQPAVDAALQDPAVCATIVNKMLCIGLRSCVALIKSNADNRQWGFLNSFSTRIPGVLRATQL